uniref:DNA-directed RNA polymerase subunit alpha n=1 Tax=Tupiella akineta TaxID=160070 RepID=RPOA_TUPAK|nr:RNA polymerase alpha subunit [Tupiella akineta]Q3ZJ77.1 RecName: Full=DNA-directed RNA polymerase subunit alpha; Short=PEP; AltName: Full=Plastid-encoded RNA polymerase subunit alpha; Short=RNA polymerase subunit alpha [Tupiella akineta]AAV80614.1 alpha subunit of RNA polymerase [Tupiella akineta]
MIKIIIKETFSFKSVLMHFLKEKVSNNKISKKNKIMPSYTLLSCIDSRVENLTKFYGRFELGPFAPGQALTVANALRRSLLSQLPGTSITLVEVRGASNEYEIITGVRESILDILLNLKQIVLTSDFEIFSPQIGFLSVEGPGVIRANDLKLPSFIYAVDPNQYIATLSNSGRLNMKFLICCGKNYITYNPNDSQYFEWLSLLKKSKPLIKSNSPKLNKGNINSEIDSDISIDKKNDEVIFFQNANTRVVDSQTALKKGLVLKNTLRINKSSFLINSNYQSFFPKTQQKAFSIFRKNSKTFLSTMGFYKEWKKEREFLKKDLYKNQEDFNKSYDFQETKKKLQTKLIKNFETPKKKLFKVQNSANPFNKAFIPLTEEKVDYDSDFNLDHKSTKIGYFPIDAIFMPINRVNYLIESTEDIKLKIKDRVILEVWTNGSIHPRHAIHKAAKALIQLFLPLQQIRTNLFLISDNSHFEEGQDKIKKRIDNFKKEALLKANPQIQANPQLKKRNFDHRLLELDIANLELTARPYSCLKLANINTIEDLISYSQEDLLSIKNFGRRSLIEVQKALQLMKLTLK